MCIELYNRYACKHISHVETDVGNIAPGAVNERCNVRRTYVTVGRKFPVCVLWEQQEQGKGKRKRKRRRGGGSDYDEEGSANVGKRRTGRV